MYMRNKEGRVDDFVWIDDDLGEERIPFVSRFGLSIWEQKIVLYCAIILGVVLI